MDILLLSKYELHELVEEQELEWISNKDAFPLVESFVDICPNHPSIISSPLSVLENVDNFSNANSVSSGGDTSSTSATASLTGSFQKLPVKPRSKMFRKRRREIPREGFPCWDRSKPIGNRRSSTSGRKCLHCGSEKTPQWRAGPSGPKTLCNACGVRYKSGRLVPEYRPACSPTFSSALHSNSHRKIVEMRKQKMGGGTGSRYSEDDEDSNLKSTVHNMST